MNSSAVVNKLLYYLERFLQNGWACIGVAIFLMVISIFSRNEEHGFLGSWFFILVAGALVLIGLGDITGLGMRMSF